MKVDVEAAAEALVDAGRWAAEDITTAFERLADAGMSEKVAADALLDFVRASRRQPLSTLLLDGAGDLVGPNTAGRLLRVWLSSQDPSVFWQLPRKAHVAAVALAAGAQLD